MLCRENAGQSRVNAGSCFLTNPYRRVVFTVEDINDTLARLGQRGAALVGQVVEYADTYRLCCIRGPEGILMGLAQELG